MPSPDDDLRFEPPPSAQGVSTVRAAPRKPVTHFRQRRRGVEKTSTGGDGDAAPSTSSNPMMPSKGPQAASPASTSTSRSSAHAAQAKPKSNTATISIPGPVAPSRTIFDPWNSASTGHQRAENRLGGSTSWRDSRSRKLSEQYRGGLSGGAQRVADTVGVGSKDFGLDGRTANGGWERGAKGLRTGGQKSLMEVWGARKVGNKLEGVEKSVMGDTISNKEGEDKGEAAGDARWQTDDVAAPAGTAGSEPPKPIFASLNFYLNGSTGPAISDQKLKHLIASHGGTFSLSLAKRRITHVILNNSCEGPGRCGGGLAAGKIQKEIATLRGKGVKFASVDWVLECVKRGKRVPEAGFATGVKVAGSGQGSVYGMFGGGKK